MKFSFILLATSLFISAYAKAAVDAQLLQKLKEVKFSLIEVITNAEKTSGPALSAKFEMDGNDLVFSVYTAPQGLKASAEETALTELSGSATIIPITSKVEIFSDKEHIARASTHLTLMQLSILNLKQIIQKASKLQAGFVFSVNNPTVRNHKAVADVEILKDNGEVSTVTIDLSKR